MTQEQPNKDDLKRTIVLVYGLLESGGPFWLFAAVRPGKYQAFLNAHKDGTLDLYSFDTYGEIIVSGEGRCPPDDVTLKVAEMFQTDPEILMKDAPEEVVGDKP